MPFPTPKPLSPDTEAQVKELLALDDGVIKDLHSLLCPPPPVANPVVAAAKVLAGPSSKAMPDWKSALQYLPVNPNDVLKAMANCVEATKALKPSNLDYMAAKAAHKEAASLMETVNEDQVSDFSTAAHALGLWVTAFLAEYGLHR